MGKLERAIRIKRQAAETEQRFRNLGTVMRFIDTIEKRYGIKLEKDPETSKYKIIQEQETNLSSVLINSPNESPNESYEMSTAEKPEQITNDHNVKSCLKKSKSSPMLKVRRKSSQETQRKLDRQNSNDSKMLKVSPKAVKNRLLSYGFQKDLEKSGRKDESRLPSRAIGTYSCYFDYGKLSKQHSLNS